jgi:serine/threonine-protein kinase
MTMYEALTGAHPFTAATLVELFMKHENEPPRLPSLFLPEIDSTFEEVLLRTLAKRPDDRHESARALRLELRAIAEQMREAAPAPPKLSAR